jgi:hypothetical protein
VGVLVGVCVGVSEAVAVGVWVGVAVGVAVLVAVWDAVAGAGVSLAVVAGAQAARLAKTIANIPNVTVRSIFVGVFFCQLSTLYGHGTCTQRV